ncbi:MAG: choice-of-anchor B family protein, partial [Gemmatimonadota bacterium]
TLYRFARTGDRWEQVGTLMAPEHEGDDFFGRFVIVDGETLIIGSTALERSGTDASDGTVFLYRKSGDSWEFDSELRPESVPMDVSFGRFGLLHDDLLFVSALGYAESRGAVWVFRRDGSGGWTEEALLTPSDVEPGEFSGWSLAFDGERLLTGALTVDQVEGQQRQNRGAAYVYRRTGPGEWTQEARLAIEGDEATPGLSFGTAVAWLDGRALIGAPGADGVAGAVYTFSRAERSGEWERGLTLTAFDRQPGAAFGTSLLVRDGALWVGAPNADGSGRVYRFAYDAANDGFGAAIKLAGIEPDVGDNFGTFMAGGQDIVVVGQTGDDFGLGSAILLEDAGGEPRPVQKVLGETPESLDPIVAGEVRCEDGRADQFDCSQVDILSFLPVSAIGGGRGAETNDVWGWTDPQTGREYALVGRTDGTAFVDVTDPENPVYLGNLPKTPGSRGNAWRDIKVYDDHAFIVADGAGEHGMQVFDLTRLRDVTSPPATFEPDTLYEEIASAHNIVINTESGTAYSVGSNSGGETCGGGLHMIDIHEPERPTFIGCFSDSRTGRAGTGYTHDAMCINYEGPDQEHVGKEICFGSNETALSIADVTDKRNPKPISVAAYPNVGYTHQGWITEDHRYFYMDDEGDEANSVSAGQPMSGTRTLIWDVTDLDDPIMVKEHFGETFTIDHNLYIVGDLMYQSNYVSGLRVLDIRDRENPREVGFFDTVPWDESVVFDGSWSNYPFFESGTLVVSSGKEGVFFLKYREPELVP